MQRAVLRFACIFLLLFAQQAAFTHAAWHAGEAEPSRHKHSGKASFERGLCGLHHDFAQVLGGVHASVPVVPSRGVPPGVTVAICRSASTLAFLAPLSRGPPTLL